MIPRYSHPALTLIWTREQVFIRWFDVGVEHVRTIAGREVGEVLLQVGPPTGHQVRWWENQTGHEMLAFLSALDRRIQNALDKGKVEPELAAKARAALHRGLTSSDVMDTALALGLQDSEVVITQEWRAASNELIKLMRRTEDKQAIGRTHGQLAAPMEASHPWSVLFAVLSRCYSRTAEAFLNARVGKLSGPVGTNWRDDEAVTLNKLGLFSTDSTQLVPRDRLANLAYQLSSLVTACEAVATQVWLLAQAGIAQVRLDESGTVGSSAMPHKRNPIMAENIRGLARMARPLAQELQLGMVQWGEHDLAHSAVERVALPDLLHLTATVLRRTATLVSGVSWEEVAPPAHYVDTNEALRRLQDSGVSYVEAHAQLSGAYRDGKISATSIEEDL